MYSGADVIVGGWCIGDFVLGYTEWCAEGGILHGMYCAGWLDEHWGMMDESVLGFGG